MSLQQLRWQVIEYQTIFPAKMFSPVFAAAVLRVHSHAAQQTDDPESRFYIQQCMTFWIAASIRHPCVAKVALAILCLGLNAGTLTVSEARIMMQNLQRTMPSHRWMEATVSCIVDFETICRGNSARAKDLAEKFDEFMIFDEMIVNTSP